MDYDQGFLDRIRETVSIADIASRWVKWDPRRSNPSKGDYWGPCLFHEDKSASFHLDEKKGFYYCFGCHAKGDVINLVREKRGISLAQAVRQLAFIAELDHELEPTFPDQQGVQSVNIIQVKEIIVQNFDHENFVEIGILTGWTYYIRNHERLLRSLRFGDPDYSGHVLDLLAAMEERGDGSYEKVKDYINKKFSDPVNTMIDVGTFSAAKRSLGYDFTAPRNDIIGVMMPFSGPFSKVYEAIKAACDTTPLPARRADEVWNSSVLITDILELINHSAVVICDLTGRNENVFYELGIAHAWGKTVIPITQVNDDVPFDLRHHRYLHYLNNDEGLQKLQHDLSARLQGLVGSKSPFKQSKSLF